MRGWYGPEFDPDADATQAIAAIDMPQVLAYAAQQGRGVFLYVNRVALEQQLDTLLPTLCQLGCTRDQVWLYGWAHPGGDCVYSRRGP